MAFKGIEMVLSAVLMTLLFAGSVTAQSQSGCTNVIISLSPCLTYITGNSSTPSSSCCSQLTTVVRSQPQCLCQVLNSGGSAMGLNINQTQALALPGACKVQTPPLSQCNSGSPVSSPPGTSDSDSDSPTTPQGKGQGSKTVPSTDGNTSHGPATKLPFSLLFLSSLTVALYASI